MCLLRALLTADDCDEGEVVEGLVEGFPNPWGSIFFDRFFVEAVHAGDLAGLVVTPKQVNAVGVEDLEAGQHQDGLQRIVPPVHVVPEEQVSGVGELSS